MGCNKKQHKQREMCSNLSENPCSQSEKHNTECARTHNYEEVICRFSLTGRSNKRLEHTNTQHVNNFPYVSWTLTLWNLNSSFILLLILYLSRMKGFSCGIFVGMRSISIFSPNLSAVPMGLRLSAIEIAASSFWLLLA